MTLLGLPLLVVLGITTVALPALTVLGWSRVRGPEPLRVAARAAMIVGCQLVAVLLVAVGVNDYGYFYGSWHDLWGAATQSAGGTPASTVVVPGSGSPGRSFSASGRVSVSTYPGFSSRRQWATKGRLDTVTITGPSSQLTTQGFVYLPPQYFQPRYAHSRFSGAEVFTGYPGTDRMLLSRLKYQDVLLRDLKRHRAHPMVLVMMRPSITFPRDTECTDVPSGPQALTFFAQDVPSVISRRFRVRPTGWGAIGSSTGGYCSAKLAMMFPSIFRAAVSQSGYYNTIRDNTTGDLWGGSQVLRDLNDLEWRLVHLPAPPVSLLVSTSRDEGGAEGHRDTRRFLSLVRPPLVVDSIVSSHGGHNFTTWAPQLPRALDWLSVRLPGPGR